MRGYSKEFSALKQKQMLPKGGFLPLLHE